MSHLEKYHYRNTILFWLVGWLARVSLGLFDCEVIVLFRSLDECEAETERLSKPLWSTGSHRGVDPYHCSRLAHIWCPNETNDLGQATVELCLHPQSTWNLPELLYFHPITLLLYAPMHTSDVATAGNLTNVSLNCFSLCIQFSQGKPYCHQKVKVQLVMVQVELKHCFGHLFEVVKRWEDDLVTSSDETDRSQQLEDQGFCPGITGDTR